MRLKFLIILMLSVSAFSTAAVAQDNTTNETIDELDVDELTGETQQIERIQIDDRVSVVGWGYDSEAEVFQIVFQSDQPTRVSLTESIQQPEGSGSFSVQEERILPDTNQLVEIPVPANGGEAAVGITTADSLDEGTGTYLSTGISENRPPIEWESAQLLIILSSIGSGVGAIRYVAKKREDETKEAERIL